jgi:GNAT superfamily N-acetyltransferase
MYWTRTKTGKTRTMNLHPLPLPSARIGQLKLRPNRFPGKRGDAGSLWAENGGQMEYHVLTRSEIAKFVDIERTESIDRVYYMRHGALVLEAEHWDVPDWNAAEKQRRIAELVETYDKGATFFGAFDGSLLVGLSVLDHNPLRSGVDRLNLAGMWVSHPYRGRGIGGMLFRLAAEEARERGAKAMYVSATPSENTIRFYTSLGCRLADPVDSHLYELEPEDIHLELTLRSREPHEATRSADATGCSAKASC